MSHEESTVFFHTCDFYVFFGFARRVARTHILLQLKFSFFTQFGTLMEHCWWQKKPRLALMELAWLGGICLTWWNCSFGNDRLVAPLLVVLRGSWVQGHAGCCSQELQRNTACNHRIERKLTDSSVRNTFVYTAHAKQKISPEKNALTIIFLMVQGPWQ